ncbi:unnamed protein product, partial [Trichogramma brassicae]
YTLLLLLLLFFFFFFLCTYPRAGGALREVVCHEIYRNEKQFAGRTYTYIYTSCARRMTHGDFRNAELHKHVVSAAAVAMQSYMYTARAHSTAAAVAAITLSCTWLAAYITVFLTIFCTVIQLQAFATRWRVPLNMKICKCAELQWNENRERCRAIKIFLTRGKARNIYGYRYSPSGGEFSKLHYLGCKRAHATETKQLAAAAKQQQQWQTCARTCKGERKLLLVSALRGMHFAPTRTQREMEELHCVVSSFQLRDRPLGGASWLGCSRKWSIDLHD